MNLKNQFSDYKILSLLIHAFLSRSVECVALSQNGSSKKNCMNKKQIQCLFFKKKRKREKEDEVNTLLISKENALSSTY